MPCRAKQLLTSHSILSKPHWKVQATNVRIKYPPDFKQREAIVKYTIKCCRSTCTRASIEQNAPTYPDYPLPSIQSKRALDRFSIIREERCHAKDSGRPKIHSSDWRHPKLDSSPWRPLLQSQRELSQCPQETPPLHNSVAFGALDSLS